MPPSREEDSWDAEWEEYSWYDESRGPDDHWDWKLDEQMKDVDCFRHDVVAQCIKCKRLTAVSTGGWVSGGKVMEAVCRGGSLVVCGGTLSTNVPAELRDAAIASLTVGGVEALEAMNDERER